MSGPALMAAGVMIVILGAVYVFHLVTTRMPAAASYLRAIKLNPPITTMAATLRPVTGTPRAR